MKIKVAGREFFADNCKIGHVFGEPKARHYTEKLNDGFSIADNNNMITAEGFASFRDAQRYVEKNFDALMGYENGRQAARKNQELPEGSPAEFERGWRDEVNAILRQTDNGAYIKKMARQIGLA